jgi:pilus assembly protein CpaE
MSNVLRLAIVDPRDDSRERIKSILLGLDIVWLEAECSRYEFFADVVSEATPDIGILNIDSDSEKALRLIERLRADTPSCDLIVVSKSTDGSMILRAMRAGAKEFLTLPINLEELAQALHRIRDAKFGGANGKSRGCQMIAVSGATGGVGCTSIAINIGCNLAANPSNSVVLVDLDLALGDADVFLDSIPDFSLLDVTQNVSRLDFQLLRKSLTKHSSGLHLLPRPVQLQDCVEINAESIRRVFGLLKASFTHIVLDLSKSFSVVDQAAMELADEVLLVVQLDLPCLRNMVRLLMSFQEMENIRDKVKVIVNRMGLESGQISLKKARETLGRDVFHQVPNDYRTMIEMRNNGVPLIVQAPKAPITLAISELTRLLSTTGAEEEAEEVDANQKAVAGPASWMSFFSGKVKAAKKS